MRDIKILIIEDSELDATLLQMILHDAAFKNVKVAGCKVVNTADGITDIIKEYDPNLLISDINLSGKLTGIAMIQLNHISIPVIITSLLVTDRERNLAHQFGAAAVVPKLMDVAEYQEALVTEVDKIFNDWD